MAVFSKPVVSGEGDQTPSQISAPGSQRQSPIFSCGGQDLGNHWSKVALAYLPDSSGDGLPFVTRVGFQGGMHHPEHYRGKGRSKYEFVATAALKNGELIWGEQALKCDVQFSLKAVLLVYSGITREETLREMPDGIVLLRHFQKGTVTSEMMEKVLLDHFFFLKNMILMHLDHINATSSGECRRATPGATDADLARICVTHPNFICPNEGAEDFCLLKVAYLRLMRMVWGDKVYLASEGQTAGVYITEPYHDMEKSYKRAALIAKLFPEHKADGRRVMTFDAGSSSVNIQTQVMYLDDTGKLLKSQSLYESNWNTGVLGGSNLANSVVRDMLKQTYGTSLEPGELAAICENFELQKGRIDWSHPERPLILTGLRPGVQYPLLPSILKIAFDRAFRAGMELLEHELERLAALGEDFSVVFCGGSLFCHGYSVQVEQLIERIAASCLDRHGVKITWAFLGDYDEEASTAVAVGAACSVVNMPLPADVLDGSALAIHQRWAYHSTPDRFEGEQVAHFLFCKGYAQDIPSSKLQPHTFWNGKSTGLGPVKGEILKLSLICDPNYYQRGPADAQAAGNRLAEVRFLDEKDNTGYRSIRVDRSNRSKDLPAPHDLDFSMLGCNLPPGLVSCAFSGPDATHLANDVDARSDAVFLTLQLTCLKVSQNGAKLRHPLDKRWLLKLATDPATKYLVVEEEKQLPTWCQCCRDWVTGGVGFWCKTCDEGVGVCWDCKTSDNAGFRLHDETHLWEVVSLKDFQELPQAAGAKRLNRTHMTRSVKRQMRDVNPVTSPEVATGVIRGATSISGQQETVPEITPSCASTVSTRVASDTPDTSATESLIECATRALSASTDAARYNNSESGPEDAMIEDGAEFADAGVLWYY